MAKKRVNDQGEYSMSSVHPGERSHLKPVRFMLYDGELSVTLLGRDVGECIDRLKQYFGPINFKIAEVTQN